MSHATASNTLKEVIGQALVDRAYRELLFADRERALTGFELSPADAATLLHLDREMIEAQAAKLGTGAIEMIIVPEPPPGPPKPPVPEPEPKPEPKPEPAPEPKVDGD